MIRSPDEALRLAEDVRAEMEAVRRVVEDARRGIAATVAEPDRLTVYAAAAILHSFYTGVEKIFLHVAPLLNGGIPATPAWHRQLLEQMSRPLPSLRPEVVSPASARLLDDYLAFRHRFRNLYMFELEWPKLFDLVRRLDEVWRVVETDLRTFEAFLRRVAADGLHAPVGCREHRAPGEDEPR